MRIDRMLHDSAIQYANALGWKLFPLRTASKEPYKDRGVYTATADVDELSEIWGRLPTANIGLNCGHSGILVFDIDEYKDSYEGTQFLTRDDEETVTALTGKGTHLYYRLADGQSFGLSSKGLPPGIDIRCMGGYAVLPPSIHPTGRQYQWEDGYSPFEVDMLPVPDALAEVLTMNHSARKPGESSPRLVQQSSIYVHRVLEAAGIGYIEQKEAGDATIWILDECPYNPPDDPHKEDRAAFVAVYGDGRIAAGCHHSRCRNMIESTGANGWAWLKEKAEIGPEAWKQAGFEAILSRLQKYKEYQSLDCEPNFDGCEY